MMQTFKDFFLNEITDSRRNREALINAYGLADDRQAADIIAQWNKYEALIDSDPETFGFPRNVKNLNPKDIFSWSRASKHLGDDTTTARENLLSMINNLKSLHGNRDAQKQQQNDYDVMFKSENLIVFKPNSEGASCKLGAGTKWCTAATKSKNMFNDYTGKKGVTLYYFHTKHEGKYALAVYPDGEMEAFDEEDNQVRIDDLERSVRDHGADLKDIVPMPSPYEPLKNMCERLIKSTQKQFADESDVMDMDQLGDDILWKCGELIRADSQGFQQFRRDTNYPDVALLSFKGEYHYHTPTGSISEENEEIVSQAAMQFFLSPERNPPGTMKQTNRLFQRQVESTIVAYMEMTVKDNTMKNEVEQALAKDIKYAFEPDLDANVSDHLVRYSKRHLGGAWTGLHELTLNLIAERPSEVVGNTVPIQLLMFTLMEKGGRWQELEEFVRSEIETINRQGWGEHNHRILRLSEFYNRMVAGVTGSPDLVKYLPTYADVQPRMAESISGE